MITHFFILSLLFMSTKSCQTNSNPSSTTQTSILQAVQNKDLDLTATLLNSGADVHTVNTTRRPLILIATHQNDISMAKLLIQNGADVNQQDDNKDSAFLYAGASGYVELAKLYLDNGARFDVFNRYYGTALIPAYERAHIDMVRLLSQTIDFPINHVNRLGWTALMEAVVLGDGSHKYAEVVRILIAAGCDISIPDNENVTALQHSNTRGFKAISQLLESAKNN